MRNSKAWFLRACFLLAGILGAYLLLWPAEPSYKGRRLNEWIRSYGDGKAEFKRSEIDEAVRAMGTDAIPFLVRWLQYEPLQQTGKLTAAMSVVIRRFNPSWERREMQFVMSSVSGFRALGPEAARAVAPLNNLLVGSKETAGWAAGAVLAYMGRVGIPPILSAMTNDSASVRKRAVKHCGSLGSNAWLAVPELLQRRGDRIEEVKEEASWVLILIRKHPEYLLPGIMANLESPEPWIRSAAMVSLSELPEFEANAAAGLQAALQNSDPGIRREATNALRRRSELPRFSLPPPKPSG